MFAVTMKPDAMAQRGLQGLSGHLEELADPVDSAGTSERQRDPADEMDWLVECWAARMIARSVLWIEGELDLQPAVDRSWQEAERDGLIAEFGADEIQAAMALAFGSVRC